MSTGQGGGGDLLFGSESTEQNKKWDECELQDAYLGEGDEKHPRDTFVTIG